MLFISLLALDIHKGYNAEKKEGELMAYHVAIVDDNAADAEFVQGVLNSWALERNVSIHVDAFPNAESFLFRYAEDKAWDILLLDIEMGTMDGVTMAKWVRQDNEAVQIVFITGYSDYIAEGYEVANADFFKIGIPFTLSAIIPAYILVWVLFGV